jgi:hypothetical protein
MGKLIRLYDESVKRSPIVLRTARGGVVIDLAQGYEGLPEAYEIHLTFSAADHLADQLHAFADAARREEKFTCSVCGRDLDGCDCMGAGGR